MIRPVENSFPGSLPAMPRRVVFRRGRRPQPPVDSESSAERESCAAGSALGEPPAWFCSALPPSACGAAGMAPVAASLTGPSCEAPRPAAAAWTSPPARDDARARLADLDQAVRNAEHASPEQQRITHNSIEEDLTELAAQLHAKQQR